VTKLHLLKHKNYLATINALPDSQLFRHLYAVDEDGKEQDIADDGNLSCAYVVSTVVHVFGWIDRPHATVKSTVTALEKSGWRETKAPRPGDIVYWPLGETENEHIGFCIDDKTAISNNCQAHAPKKHDMILEDGRQPTKFLTYDYDKEEDD
jgi:hypothetical protein